MKKKRVVFYGRVSTTSEEQLSALDNQMQWYQNLLESHPEWEVVGVYEDDAVIIGLNQKTFDLRGFTD